MKVERVSGRIERRILIGMIVDDAVLGRVTNKWDPTGRMFRSRWADIIGNLCVKYHRQYGKAPGKSVEGLFESWVLKARDKDTVALVEKFLASLSNEYEELAQETNSSYLIDQAGNFFTRVKLERLTDQVRGEIDQGELDNAILRVVNFNRVDMGAGSAVDVLTDTAALEKAFSERAEPLLVLPGELGRFFGNSLQREGFIAFLAPEKRGKTTWLVDFAWLAMLQRRRVAFFSVGDESEEEMMIRFAMRATGRPSKPDTVRYPMSIEREGREVRIDYKERTFDRGLTVQEAKEAFARTQRDKLRSKRSFLRLSVHPNSTLSVKGMEEQLKQWEREGWVPDVIVVDYMDILDESGMSGDQTRDRINRTWKDFRGMLQRWHALGITATQADAEGGETALLSRRNFSEDKRKLSHVTGMVGLNQSDDEKKQGVMRLNWIVRRGDYYSSKRCLRVAGCMAVGRPAVRFCF